MSVDQVQQSEQGIPDLHEHDDGVSQLLQDNLNVRICLICVIFFECPFTNLTYVCKRGVGSNQNKGGQTESRKSVSDNLRTYILYIVSIKNSIHLKCAPHFWNFRRPCISISFLGFIFAICNSYISEICM